MPNSEPLSFKTQPPIRAVPMGLFPTLNNLNEVLEIAQASVPISDRNELYALFMAYHNTLLEEIKKDMK